MPTIPPLLSRVLSLALCCSATAILAQGSLTPPGAPAPTMKTLAQIEPRFPISTIPTNITVPGSYYLTTNLTGIAGTNGITILTNDVTIDLNGFVLAGVTNSGDGIFYPDTVRNVAVHNGTIRGWDDGINGSLFSNYDSHFRNLRVLKNTGAGILAGFRTIVQDCLVNENGGAGITVYYYSLVRNCVANNNGNLGIYAGNSVVQGCTVNQNGAEGIQAFAGSTVRDCVVNGNTRSGINSGGEGFVVGNVCIGNNPSGNANWAGIYVFFGRTRVEGNHVVYSTGAGIKVDPAQARCVIVRNTLVGTLANAISVPAGNDVGPIGSAATATSPWSNIQD